MQIPNAKSAILSSEADVCGLLWNRAAPVNTGTPPGKHGGIHLS